MARHTTLIKRALGALAGTAALATLTLPASAQTQQAPPSYAVHGDESIRGTIASFDGKYGVTVRDERGFIDNVRLHDGTIINPRGLRLASGEQVTVYGHADGPAFTANEIDTPYRTVLVTGYPYGFGYPYGYGPGYRIGFGYGGYGFGRFGFGFGGRF